MLARFIDTRWWVVRDRPVLLPAPGIQLVSLTHVEDAVSMLAAVPGNPAAVKQHYNLSSDRAMTHEGARSLDCLQFYTKMIIPMTSLAWPMLDCSIYI